MSLASSVAVHERLYAEDQAKRLQARQKRAEREQKEKLRYDHNPVLEVAYSRKYQVMDKDKDRTTLLNRPYTSETLRSQRIQSNDRKLNKLQVDEYGDHIDSQRLIIMAHDLEQ